MSEWQTRFNEFMADWMRKAKGLPCDKVTSVESSAYEYSYGCDTCGGGMDYEVDINWVDEEGNKRFNSFSGKLEDIIAYV